MTCGHFFVDSKKYLGTRAYSLRSVWLAEEVVGTRFPSSNTFSISVGLYRFHTGLV